MKNIKITNSEINKIVQLLNDKDSLLNSNDPNRRFPVALLWNIETNFKKFSEINQRSAEAEQKIRSTYFDEKHTDPELDADGNPTGQIKIKPEYQMNYIKELNELAMVENELSIVTIPFKKIEEYELNGSELQSIKFMIDDPVDEETPVEIETVSGEVE